eukprot:1193564-Prorocentrum_minimum.AAC.3
MYTPATLSWEPSLWLAGVYMEVSLPTVPLSLDGYVYEGLSGDAVGCGCCGASDRSSVDLSKVDNVLDRWILAATQTLTRQVEKEMEAYKLYNVVPRLLTFIEQLTNIYVRFNRKRLKGAKGPEDTVRALGTLYSVLMTLCKAMAPCTPFFTETMYQNLRR